MIRAQLCHGRGRCRSLHSQFFQILGVKQGDTGTVGSYKVADGVDDALRKRYVNKMDKEGDSSTPGLVGLRVPTIAK